MLYDPCTHPAMVDELRRLVSNCMRKHVITPYHGLTKERPLAIVTWGCVMQMNYVRDKEVVSFIRVSPRYESKDANVLMIDISTENCDESPRMECLQGRSIQETATEAGTTSFRIKQKRCRPLSFCPLLVYWPSSSELASSHWLQAYLKLKYCCIKLFDRYFFSSIIIDLLKCRLISKMMIEAAT